MFTNWKTHIVKLAILSKATYRFNIIPGKIPVAFLPKWSWSSKLELQVPLNSQNDIFKKQNWRTHTFRFQNLTVKWDFASAPVVKIPHFRGIGWRGRWEGGSGMGIHVYPWLIHVNVWQKPLQYCKVISLQLIKKKKIPHFHYRGHRFDLWLGN